MKFRERLMTARTFLIVAAILIVCAIELRIAAVSWRDESAVNFGDAGDYIIAAQAICQQSDYPEASELPFFRAPGLPLFLALASNCQLDSATALKMLIIALDILGMIGVLLITRRVGLGRSATLVAGTFYAVSPMIIGQSIDIQSEPLFQTSLIACTLGVLTGTLPASILAGGALGVAALTRPVALGFFPFFLCALVVIKHRIFISHLLGFLIGMGLLIAPWTFANKARTGEFILINDAFGYNFWRGSLPIMQLIYDAKDQTELQALSRILEHELTPKMTAETEGMSRRERSAFFERAAWEEIFADLPAAVRLLRSKAFVFLRPWLDSSAWKREIVLITGAWEAVLYLSGIVGLVVVWTRSKSAALLIIAYLTAALLFSLPFQVVARFRIPFFEWVLILLAAVAFDNVLAKKNRAQVPNTASA